MVSGASERIVHQSSVAHAAQRHIFPALEPSSDFPHVSAKRGDQHFGIISLGYAELGDTAALQHCILRRQNFRQRAFHEDQFVGSAFRDRKEKLGDDLHRLAFGLVDEIGLPGKPFDGLPLAITTRIVQVWLAFEIGEQRQTTGGQHLHHERRARARQTRNDGDHDSPFSPAVAGCVTVQARPSRWPGRGRPKSCSMVGATSTMAVFSSAIL